MKKILAIVSLVLVLMMLASASTFAEGYEYTWEDPKDIPKYYATDISGKATPVIDGEIKEGEYGNAIVITDNYITMGDKYPELDYTIQDGRADHPASEKFEYYFSYDNENIYIAFKDYGAVWEQDSATAQWLDSVPEITDGYVNFAVRSNYYIRLGFMLDDITNGISLGCSSRGFDESRVYDMGTASSYVSIGDLVEELYMKKYLAKDGTVFAKCDVNGSLISDVRGNTNQYEGQFIAECEIKLSKSHIVEVLNEWHFTEFTELGNACWINITNRAYVGKKNPTDVNDAYGEPVTCYNRYFCNDIRGKKADYVNYGILEGDKNQIIGSLLVFAPEGTPIEMCKEGTEVVDTTPAATEPAATEPAGDTPAATEPAGDTPAATEPAATEPAGDAPVATEPAGDTPAATEPAKEGGCGGAVSFAGLALVAALGTCTVFVAKKKED